MVLLEYIAFGLLAVGAVICLVCALVAGIFAIMFLMYSIDDDEPAGLVLVVAAVIIAAVLGGIGTFLGEQAGWWVVPPL